MRYFLAAILAVTALAAASCDLDPPSTVNDSECGGDDRVLLRAPDGDFLCKDKGDCYHTSGSPVGGCPNTCSCLCMHHVCYQDSCTLVVCDEPPIYN